MENKIITSLYDYKEIPICLNAPLKYYSKNRQHGYYYLNLNGGMTFLYELYMNRLPPPPQHQGKVYRDYVNVNYKFCCFFKM